MVLKLQRYNLEFSFIPGKLLFVADMLSRGPRKEASDSIEKEFEFAVHSIITQLDISEELLKTLVNASATDPITQALIDQIQQGWPTHKHQANTQTRQFWQFKNQLTVNEGLVFKDTSFFVP